MAGFQKTHEKPKGNTTTKVGFYGCSGKVVRLQATGKFPGALRVHCSACGHTHGVKPFWRKRIDALDKGVFALDVTPKETDGN